jgi:hypothetical protein
MPYERTWLAPRYDTQTWALAMRAIRASRRDTGVRAWVTSPAAEYRKLDAGGFTFHEREFVRSFYRPFNQARKAAAAAGTVPDWSARVRLVSPDYVISRTGYRARLFQFRVWPRSKARVAGPRWTDSYGLQSGGIGSGRERYPA